MKWLLLAGHLGVLDSPVVDRVRRASRSGTRIIETVRCTRVNIRLRISAAWLRVERRRRQTLPSVTTCSPSTIKHCRNRPCSTSWSSLKVGRRTLWLYISKKLLKTHRQRRYCALDSPLRRGIQHFQGRSRRTEVLMASLRPYLNIPNYFYILLFKEDELNN